MITTGLSRNFYMKTLAAVLRKVHSPLVLEEIELPPLSRGQVLVRIQASGLCHSQLNEIRGRKGKEYIPHLMGHEAVGTVLEIGPDVTKVHAGQYVVITWLKGAGIEAVPPKYTSDDGAINAGAAATFLTKAIVSENRVVPIDAHIPPAVGAILGCAIPTGMGAVRNLSIQPGNNVIVFGAGGIGASALMMAKYLGAHTTAVDIAEWKLDWAQKTIGVDTVLKPDGVTDKIYDYAIECSGNKQAMETAFSCIKDSGTTVIAGNLEPGQTISVDPFSLVKGKKLQGTWGGNTSPDTDIPWYATQSLNAKNPLPLDKLVTAEYPFERINEGLKDLEDGKLIRGVITMS